VTRTQKHGDQLSASYEVHTIAWTMIDPKLRYATANRANITWIARSQMVKTRQDPRLCLAIRQPANPGIEIRRFENFDYPILLTAHTSIVNRG
jgi:hypothetical protein